MPPYPIWGYLEGATAPGTLRDRLKLAKQFLFGSGARQHLRIPGSLYWSRDLMFKIPPWHTLDEEGDGIAQM